MAEKIDMSLDDIIKRDKISTGRKRGQSGGLRGRGGAQRGQRGGGRQVGGGPQRTTRITTRSRALPYSRVLYRA